MARGTWRAGQEIFQKTDPTCCPGSTPGHQATPSLVGVAAPEELRDCGQTSSL